MEKLALAHFALLAVLCLAIGAARWIQRKGADLRGRRLPPMRIL